MIDRLKADLRDAMRAGDRTRIDTIRMLISQIQYARIELKREPGGEDPQRDAPRLATEEDDHECTGRQHFP